MIKAIETRYKGYRFRSRLEARWAVFFDAMGMEWQYEPEGFVLSTGEHYLPDFYVAGVYAEVKPDRNLRGFEKAMQFAVDIKDSVIGLGGMPETIAYPVFASHNNQSTLEVSDVAINGCMKYGPFYWCCGVNIWENWQDLHEFSDSNRIERRACEAAKAARFEHTERWAPA